MDATPPPFARFGYTLAFAERTLTAVLRAHLAERDVTPETWYALQLITTRGPVLDRDALTADLQSARSLNAETTRELLVRLAADGLIRGESEVELTRQGEALHRSLAEYVAVPRNRLLSQFDAGDIETTMRTLQAIAERAAEEASLPAA
jgi:hypothetical protein